MIGEFQTHTLKKVEEQVQTNEGISKMTERFEGTERTRVTLGTEICDMIKGPQRPWTGLPVAGSAPSWCENLWPPPPWDRGITDIQEVSERSPAWLGAVRHHKGIPEKLLGFWEHCPAPLHTDA